MRFGAALLLSLTLPALLPAQHEISPKTVESTLGRWFPVTCAPAPLTAPMTLALICPPKNNPGAPPILVGAATLEERDLAMRISVVDDAAARPKVKVRKSRWDTVMNKRMALKEPTPGGRLGFYGAHSGLTESALSFIVVDPTTRVSLQLMYTYRLPPPDISVNEKASAKSMDQIFEKLKRAGFALEKRYWSTQ